MLRLLLEQMELAIQVQILDEALYVSLRANAFKIFWLFGFNGISTFVGYLMPNP